MKNGIRTWSAGICTLVLSAALAGCGPGAVQTVAKSAPTAYPAPEIQIVAQPVLASYNQRASSKSAEEYTYAADSTYSSNRHRRKHSRHRKVSKGSAWGPDQDLGYMAADDPKLLQAEIAAKEPHKEDWKQWVAPPEKAPDGR